MAPKASYEQKSPTIAQRVNPNNAVIKWFIISQQSKGHRVSHHTGKSLHCTPRELPTGTTTSKLIVTRKYGTPLGTLYDSSMASNSGYKTTQP